MASKDNIFLRIKKNYNDGLKICKNEPLGTETGQSRVVCGMEQIMEQSIALRPSSRRILREKGRIEEDEEPMAPMEKQMCGCRLTAIAMFIMISFNIDIPYGKKFFDTYSELVENPFVQKIMGSGFSKAELVKINEIIPNILPVTPSNLYIVQILKLINWPGVGDFYTPVHSFVVKVDHSSDMCYVLSSWYSGGESSATPVIYNKISFMELQLMLSPEHILSKEITDKLFGSGNNLDGNLAVLFLSKDLLDSGIKIGGKRKRKRKQKTKRKKKKRNQKSKKKKSKRKINKR